MSLALLGIPGYPLLMDFTLGNKYMELAAYVLLAMALGAAIFFWGRGIRNVRKSDLLAGPAILVALCIALFCLHGSFEIIGELVIVFGIATLLLSALTRPGSAFSRRDVLAIGGGAIIVGFCLLTIL